MQALLVSATHFPVKWVFTGNFWEIVKFAYSLVAHKPQKIGALDTQFPKKNTGKLISITGIQFIDCSEVGSHMKETDLRPLAGGRVNVVNANRDLHSSRLVENRVLHT